MDSYFVFLQSDKDDLPLCIVIEEKMQSQVVSAALIIHILKCHVRPFIMEEAEALKEATPAFKNGQPVGDGIGPMVVGKLMLELPKDEIAFQTVLSESEFEGRKLYLMKAQGPLATVGRLGDALEEFVSKNKPDAIIMIDLLIV